MGRAWETKDARIWWETQTKIRKGISQKDEER